MNAGFGFRFALAFGFALGLAFGFALALTFFAFFLALAFGRALDFIVRFFPFDFFAFDRDLAFATAATS
jgi:hypothetical protein